MSLALSFTTTTSLTTTPTFSPKTPTRYRIGRTGRWRAMKGAGVLGAGPEEVCVREGSLEVDNEGFE